MCTVPSMLPSQDTARSFEVQLPSLKGIRVPALETPPSLSDPPSFADASPPARPFVHRIDTGCSIGLNLEHNSVQSTGLKHSRSLEAFADSIQLSSPGCFDSAASDSLLLPWSKQLDAAHELSSSSLPGLYISHSSRKTSSTAVATNFAPPTISALTYLDPALDSPSPIFDSEESVESEEDTENEDVWNLIPYDISWGPAYYGYRKGTLPGPDGKCIFLRSPTPLKYQRTGQACEKCRERKAKCSGSRPSCARCVMRGLACIYASDTKSTKPEDPSVESALCAAPVEVRPVHFKPSNHLAAPSAARIRRNTDCGSHGARLPVQSRNAALRRRHSTIGSSCSPVASGGLEQQVFREHRSTIGAAGDNSTRGFLGALLDPLIGFPENGPEGDDLRVSESSRLSYHTLLRSTEAVTSLTLPTYPRTDAGGHNSGSDNTLSHAQHQSEWEAQPSMDNGLLRNSSLLAMDSYSSDLLEKRPTYAESVIRVSSQSHHLLADTSYDDGYVHQALDDKSIQTYSIFGRGSEGASFDYDMSDASRVGMAHYEWACDATPQTKIELMDYSMDTDTPQIALPCHSPDFFHFNHCEDARAWFSLDDG